jgi:hypothetical protein
MTYPVLGHSLPGLLGLGAALCGVVGLLLLMELHCPKSQKENRPVT